MNVWKWTTLTKKLFLTLILFAHLGCSHSQGEFEPLDPDDEEQWNEPLGVSEILRDMFNDYEKMERPFYREKALEMKVKLEISSISHVSEENMEFQSTVYFTQIWEDPRIAFDKSNNKTFLVLREENLKKLWLPDTYIVPARKVSIETYTYSAKVYGNGTIHYSYRMLVSAIAKMDFQNYPLDNQVLYLGVYSYFYNYEQLNLKWDKASMVPRDFDLAGFVVKSVKKISEIHTDGKDNFSYLSLAITIHRDLGYFIMQFYFPCILCAVVSWLPFWMDRYEIGDRMALSITTLLTEVFLSQYINSEMPRVSYIKAADEYLLATFIFIFMGLLENVVVYNNRSDVRKAKKEKKKKAEEKKKKEERSKKFKFELQDVRCYSREITSLEEMTENNINRLNEEASRNTDDNSIKIDAQQESNSAPEKDRSLIVDKISRCFFPLVFLVFQAYYFGRYL